MRVVGGSAKGRSLTPVPGASTRPILDRVKTALFDILRPTLDGIAVLDLFAGTGGVGIEALSQGAASCVFVDVNERAIQTIKHNLVATELRDKADVRHTDAFTYLRNTKRKFDLIYVAPPQHKGLWVRTMHQLAERPHLLNPDGRVIVQIDPIENEELTLEGFEKMDERRYGNTLLVFWQTVGYGQS